MQESMSSPKSSMWTGRVVFLTGACGFIGSHLAEELVQRGARVTAMVEYNRMGSNGWLDMSPLAKEMRIVSGDIRDSDFMNQTVRGQDTVFHLAALIGIPYSYLAPESYIKTNVLGTLNLLQAARRAGVQRVVHTSTSEVYGTARYAPIDEAHPLQGQSPYAASKIAADKLAEAFQLSFELPCVTVRPFNTFGPRQSSRAVIPTIISQILQEGRVKLGSLSPTRDLNFVGNTVGGFLAAGSSPKAVGGTFNLGSGREISIGDLATLIGTLMGHDVSVITDDQRIRPTGSEVERLLADNALARNVLGWMPEIDLETGLMRTIEWFRENNHYYHTDRYSV
jgi:NAD dependent epimerase/dehydratase